VEWLGLGAAARAGVGELASVVRRGESCAEEPQGVAQDFPALASWWSGLAAVAVAVGLAPMLGGDGVCKVLLDWHALSVACTLGSPK
jgi:hypothetical protein